MSKNILKEIKKFCNDAIKDANDALEENLTDGSEGIYEGRLELAESLLDQIKEWESI